MAVSTLCDLGVGITLSFSVLKILSMMGLFSALPATMAPNFMASSRLSNRRSALRAALSGPWQAKQFSERMGRMSLLYLSLSAPCTIVVTKTSMANEDIFLNNMINPFTLDEAGLPVTVSSYINFSALEPMIPILKGILLVLKQRIATVLAEDVLVAACV